MNVLGDFYLALHPLASATLVAKSCVDDAFLSLDGEYSSFNLGL